jgi:outer membrane protein OmpA-like peptidoglycan-associated protein
MSAPTPDIVNKNGGQVNKCFRKFLPWLIGGALAWLALSAILSGPLSSNLKSALNGKLAADAALAGVTINKMDGQDVYLSGPASLEASARAAVKGYGDGEDTVFYTATAEPAPSAPATTVAPATTAAPVTTAAPAPTTAAPATTTAAPAPTTVAPKACPALPALTSVNFETNSATLAGDAPNVLANVVAALKAAPGCKITVIGHTDNRGTDAANQSLSEARAASVVDYLVSQGIPAANLTSLGKGESEPVAGSDQTTEAGLAVNRRIEFKPTNLGS